jgi:hypothetical protein
MMVIGFGSDGRKYVIDFIRDKMKFSEKTKAILELVERLNYVTVSEGLKESITRISKMLYSIIHKLRT